MGSTTLAMYTPAIKEILYSENIPDILLNRADILVHELFHAYQHQMVYGTVMTGLGSNHINIEFEQIVFQDIVRSMSNGAFEIGDMFNQEDKPGFTDAQNAYRAWIHQLTSEATAYPDLNSIPGFDAAYMTHLNSFKTYGHITYTSTNIVPGLLPNALKQLYNNSFNCNN